MASGRRAAISAFVLAGAGLVAACSGLFGKSAAAPDCPPVNVLDEASRITVYRPGQGRDISDIAYEARILGFQGDCSYTAANSEKQKAGKYTDVVVNVRARFRVAPGPALSGPRVTVNYFVAMPDFYPNPEGRADFSQIAEIPPSRTPIEFTDSDIQVSIPLGETRSGASVPVYLGLVMTEEQLQQNRRRTGGRLEP